MIFKSRSCRLRTRLNQYETGRRPNLFLFLFQNYRSVNSFVHWYCTNFTGLYSAFLHHRLLFLFRFYPCFSFPIFSLWLILFYLHVIHHYHGSTLSDITFWQCSMNLSHFSFSFHALVLQTYIILNNCFHNFYFEYGSLPKIVFVSANISS